MDTAEQINIQWLWASNAAIVSIGNPDLEHWAGWPFTDYTMGIEKPHYPMPAILIHVGYQTEHVSQQYPSAYWYVCSDYMLWSIFAKYGLVTEHV